MKFILNVSSLLENVVNFIISVNLFWFFVNVGKNSALNYNLWHKIFKLLALFFWIFIYKTDLSF